MHYLSRLWLFHQHKLFCFTCHLCSTKQAIAPISLLSPIAGIDAYSLAKWGTKKKNGRTKRFSVVVLSVYPKDVKLFGMFCTYTVNTWICNVFWCAFLHIYNDRMRKCLVRSIITTLIINVSFWLLLSSKYICDLTFPDLTSPHLDRDVDEGGSSDKVTVNNAFFM